MKKYLLFILLAALTYSTAAQDKPDYLEKVKTLDSTIETLYGVISGEKNEARNWELFRFLFHENAKLIPSGKTRQEGSGVRYMSVEDYITSSGKWLEENGFFEKELHRMVESFGTMTHAFSTYESYRSQSDKAPFARGINSIQLMNDGTRWWIINIYWTQESPENPIPKQYLPK